MSTSSWSVVQLEDEVHIIPGDPEEHQMDECWCNPFIDRDENGKTRVNHNVEKYKPAHGPRR